MIPLMAATMRLLLLILRPMPVLFLLMMRMPLMMKPQEYKQLYARVANGARQSQMMRAYMLLKIETPKNGAESLRLTPTLE